MPAGPRCLGVGCRDCRGRLRWSSYISLWLLRCQQEWREKKEWSSWCSRCKRRNVTQSSGSWACGLTEVNCFVKYFVIADGLVQVLKPPSWLVKLMGCLGGMRVRLPDRDLSWLHNFLGVALWQKEETVDLHLVLAVSLMR